MRMLTICFIILNLTGHLSKDIETTMKNRRAGFVDSLLNADGHDHKDTADLTSTLDNEFQMPDAKETTNASANMKGQGRL